MSETAKCSRCEQGCEEYILRRGAVLCVRCISTEADVLYGAVCYVLDRAQLDPEGLGYHLGPHVEAFERLVAAEATRLNEEFTVVRARRSK